LPDMHEDVQYAQSLEEPEPQDPWIAILRGRKRPEIELDPATEEYIVTVTASIAQHFIHKDRAVGMVTYAQGREVMQPDRGHRQLTKMLETLAVIRAEGDIPLGQILLGEGAALGRGVTLVVITSSLDSMWVAAARDIRRRGVSVIAVVVDPNGFGGPEGAERAIGELQASRIPAYMVRRDDNLSEALSRQMSFSRPPI
jgi:uncharacterized protein (DUF58 family)